MHRCRERAKRRRPRGIFEIIIIGLALIWPSPHFHDCRREPYLLDTQGGRLVITLSRQSGMQRMQRREHRATGQFKALKRSGIQVKAPSVEAPC